MPIQLPGEMDLTIEQQRARASDLGIRQKIEDSDFIIFDLETTGGNPEKNGITEVFAMRYRKGEIIDTFYSLVNPMQLIPPIVRKMTGINNRMLKDAPTIDEVMPQLVDFIGNDVLVSHNTIGDLKFLQYFARKVCNTTLFNYFVCTHLLSEKLLAEAKDKSLKGLGVYLKLGDAEAHRAEDDTYLTLGLFQVLVAKLAAIGIETIIDAIRLQGDTGSSLRIGWGLLEDDEKRAPKTPGLIEFFDRKKRKIFVTSSPDMHRSMRQLKQGSMLPKKLFKTLAQAYHVNYDKEPSLIEAMLAEAKAFAASKTELDASYWSQRQILAFLIKTEGRSIRVQVGTVDEGTLFAFGPLHDRKLGMQYVDELGQVLGVKATRKGFVVDRIHLKEIVNAFLHLNRAARRKGETPRSETQPKSIVGWMTQMLSIFSDRTKQTELQSRIRALRSPFSVHPLLYENGFLVRHVEGSVHVLHPVIQGMIRGSIAVEQELEPWLLEHGVKTLRSLGAKPELAIHPKATRMGKRGLSRLDAFLYNASLWLVYSSGFGRKGALRFIDIEKVSNNSLDEREGNL